MAAKKIKLKINRRVFEKEVAKGRSSKVFKDLAYKKAEERAEEAKKELLKEFEESKITQELQAGSGNMKNISRNLLGLPYGKGSLFGFIGFNHGDDPVSEVRSYLKATGHLYKTSRFQKRGKTGGTYEFKVETPDINAIESLTPMPWEGGRSWVRGIERGISGLGYYIANHSRLSRSGQGIQSKNVYNQAAMYKPSKYMSQMISNFIRVLQGRKPR